MPQPTPYTRQYDFSDWSANNPSSPQPGQQLDNEFEEIRTTFNEILTNIALIQRDDGALKNASVGLDQLNSEVLVTIGNGDIAADITAVAAIVDDVTAVAGISANVSTVAGIAADVTTVAENIVTISDDISTVTGIAADIVAVAAISADVQNAEANATTAQNAADAAEASAAEAAAIADYSNLTGFCNAIRYYDADESGTYLPNANSSFIEYEIYAGAGGSHDGASTSGTDGGDSSLTGIASATGGTGGTASSGNRAADGDGTDGEINGFATQGGDTQGGQWGGRGGYAKGKYVLTTADKQNGIAYSVGAAGTPDGQGGAIIIREFGKLATTPFVSDPRVTSFYDSLGNYFKSNASQTGGWNDQVELYFTTSRGVQDMATDGAHLLRSTAVAAGGSTFLIDDSVSTDPIDWTRGATYYTALLDTLNSGSGASTSDAIIIHGGTNDANASGGVTKAKYKQALTKLKEFVQADFENANFIILNILHRNVSGAGSDVNYQAVREAQQEIIASDEFFKEGITFYDVDLRDNAHPTDAAFYGEMARRQAKNLAYHAGVIPITGVFGPRISSVIWDGVTATLTAVHDAGTDFAAFPTDVENMFSIVSDGTETHPATVTKNSATEIECDFSGTGLTPGEVMNFYVGYGGVQDLSQTSAEVIVDNASNPMPLRMANFTIPASNPIPTIGSLQFHLDASLSTKVFSGSDVTSVTDLLGNVFGSGAGRYPEFSSGFLTSPDTSTHLLNTANFTPDAVNGEAFGGAVLDFPAVFAGDVSIFGFGTSSAGSVRAMFRIRSSDGHLLWSRNDADGFQDISGADVRGTKGILVWNFKSLSSVDMYYNSLIPVNFDPWDTMTAQNRVYLFSERTTYASLQDLGIGYFFHKSEERQVADPTVSDIMNYLNTRFGIGLSL